MLLELRPLTRIGFLRTANFGSTDRELIYAEINGFRTSPSMRVPIGRLSTPERVDWYAGF